MIGKSPAFLELARLIRKIAGSEAPILIEGETGTGKELTARAIHFLSPRCDGPFIQISCGTVSESRLEHELFESPENASLFLNEVDALTTKGQFTLLRFLQEKTTTPGLSDQSGQISAIRIIAATNANLMKLVETGHFRPDLLFRLNIFPIKLPPLRERHGDAELLARHFIRKNSAKYEKPDISLHPDTVRWLSSYSWPGNVRELENFIHREFLLAEGSVILANPTTQSSERRTGEDRRNNGESAAPDFNAAKAKAISEFERKFLCRLLSQTHGNVTMAAKIAGKERRSLGKLLKKYGIDKSQYAHSH